MHSRLEENIDDLLSQANADSLILDRMSALGAVTNVATDNNTCRYEYNHGHETYSPQYPQLQIVPSSSATISSEQDTEH